MISNSVNLDYFNYDPMNFSDKETYAAVYERAIMLWKVSKYMKFKLPTMQEIAKPYEKPSEARKAMEEYIESLIGQFGSKKN